MVEGIRRRDINADHHDTLPKSTKRKPRSTDTVIGTNGMKYHREDQLDFHRLFKTSIVTILVSILIGYFFLKTYRLLWDFLLNYWMFYDEMDMQEYALRASFLIIKGLVAFVFVYYLNKKLLLKYGDEDELSYYN